MVKKEEKKKNKLIWTPPGRFSWCYFAKKDEGRQYSDLQYKTDLFIPKSIFKDKPEGKILQDEVLRVGKDHFGAKFSLKSGEYRVPFVDTDLPDEEGKMRDEVYLNSIMLRAKQGQKGDPKGTNKAPIFFGPRKNAAGNFDLLTEDQIKDIKAGDWGKLNVSVYAYDGSKSVQPGISLGLVAVQFWKADKSFGGGISKLMETMEELETEIDSIEDEEVSEDTEESESIV